jgi:hypothetical protein
MFPYLECRCGKQNLYMLLLKLLFSHWLVSPRLWRWFVPPKRRFLQEPCGIAPDDGSLHSHCREDLECYKICTLCVTLVSRFTFQFEACYYDRTWQCFIFFFKTPWSAIHWLYCPHITCWLCCIFSVWIMYWCFCLWINLLMWEMSPVPNIMMIIRRYGGEAPCTVGMAHSGKRVVIFDLWPFKISWCPWEKIMLSRHCCSEYDKEEKNFEICSGIVDHCCL